MYDVLNHPINIRFPILGMERNREQARMWLEYMHGKLKDVRRAGHKNKRVIPSFLSLSIAVGDGV